MKANNNNAATAVAGDKAGAKGPSSTKKATEAIKNTKIGTVFMIQKII